MKINELLKIIFSIFICHSAGIVGSFFTISSVNTWYTTIQKPFFTPPGWVFGPVWLTLYTLMGISLYLVWKNGITEKNKKGLILFFIQLALNGFWSIAFFGFQSPLFGLIVIIPLLAFILTATFEFYNLNKNAAYLLIPYIVWVAVATALNTGIWILN